MIISVSWTGIIFNHEKCLWSRVGGKQKVYMLGMQFFYENVYVIGKKLGGYASQVAQWMQETQIESPGREDPLEEGMATHASILPGEPYGQRSLVGCSPRVTESWDERAHCSAGGPLKTASQWWDCGELPLAFRFFQTFHREQALLIFGEERLCLKSLVTLGNKSIMLSISKFYTCI